VGAQKCGTSSLYDDVVAHPCARRVEERDRLLRPVPGWRRAVVVHFPSGFRKYVVRRVRGQPLLTGEASTRYIGHSAALRPIRALVPAARIILLLRNPVDRAFSAYNHTVRMGHEPLSFEEAIAREEERVGRAWAARRREADYFDLDIPL
jgi:hypothetical protein